MKKIYRLKKNHDIAKIVQKKQRIAKTNYIVYYQYSDEKIPKIAFSVSKKYGIAVERNKAKRIARSIVREKIKEITNVNMVIVIKAVSKKCDYAILKNELSSILKKILINKTGGVIIKNEK